MRFESARELKEEALSRFTGAPVVRASAAGIEGLHETVIGPLGSARGDYLMLSLGLQGSASIGLGIALANGEDCKLAIRYPWLDRRRAPHLDELTSLARGEVDVDWTGPLVAQRSAGEWRHQRWRPLKIGSSVSHDGGTAGTVCAFVRRGGGAAELLSCNHVIADCGRAPANVAVLQPGPSDGGGASDLVGHLAHAYPLDRTSVNVVDCAVATLDTRVGADHAGLDGFGDLAGKVDAAWYAPSAEGESVAKIGRTTEGTRGRVTVLEFAQNVNYPGFGRCFFDELIEITGDQGPFSLGGDSGSLVFLPDDRLGVGVVIGNTHNHKSYATRLDTVLSRLGAELVV